MGGHCFIFSVVLVQRFTWLVSFSNNVTWTGSFILLHKHGYIDIVQIFFGEKDSSLNF